MSAIEKLITDNIDVWLSAIKRKNSQGRGSSNKIELYGIKKLRELILELAVRGQLVPQDPNDEPASVLLEKIAKEKAKLFKEGKIKKQKVLPEISEDSKTFILPDNWNWVRFQDISEYIQRGKGPKYSESGKVKVISQKCIQWGGFDLTPARHVDDISLIGYQSERFLKSNDLLWNSTGTGTVGRINVIDDVEERSLVADSHVTVIRTLLVNTGYIWSYISAPGVQNRIEPTHENALVSGTTKQVELNTSSVIQLVLPIPPINEQNRIVAKVSELMSLCDQLESQQNNSIAAHEQLVEVLLNTLTQSANNQELTNNWQRLAEHFDTLFTTESSIEKLKQTILQLAVMGKLVPQDPNDEPAAVLLEKIAKEKAKLIEEGKIKKQKALPEITEEEKPFELPEGWVFTRFGDVFDLEYGNNLPARKRSGTGEYAVYGSNGVVGTHNQSCIKRPCIIVGRKGSAGALNLCLDKECWVTDVAYSVVPSNGLDLEYVFRMFHTLGLGVLGKGIKPGLNRNEAYILCVAIPPLKEQHRIVAKVEEIMALCEQLKARLTDAQATQLNLADALAEQAIA